MTAHFLLFMFTNQKNYQQKNKYSDGAATGINEHVENSAGSFRHKILVDFIACCVKYAGDQRNVKFVLIECKINRSAHAESESGIFREMGDFSQHVVRNDVAEILDYYAQNTLADFLGLLAVFA